MTVGTKAKIVQNYIDGEWVDALSGKMKKSLNPANIDEVIGFFQNSGEKDVDRAVTVANKAKKEWAKLSGPARGSYLYKVADILERRRDEIAETLTREMGKTLPESKGETQRGIDLLRYYAGEGTRKIGDVIPSTDREGLMFTTRVPLGVVGVITPWNFPVAIPIWKIAPALVYGNTVVFKPAEETAVTGAKIVECFHEAGIPSGVVNMVTGEGSVVGEAMTNHVGINGITFTGSNTTGKRVGQNALSRGAKYQLEMGGKNPVIVTEDADLDLAVEATISGGLRSTGQKCTATSRVIVVDKVYDLFKERLLTKVKEIHVGNGMDSKTWMGPLVSQKQLDKVLSYIDKGVEEKASLIYGGQRLTYGDFNKGYFIQPTVFENVTSSMKIAQEEIFGPILTLIRVPSLGEALELANDTQFGLSASIFTRNIDSILQFIQKVEAGMIRINSETAGVEYQAPFGGMKASSSHSREQGQAAIEFFTSIKTVFVKSS